MHQHPPHPPRSPMSDTKSSHLDASRGATVRPGDVSPGPARRLAGRVLRGDPACARPVTA
jgi:hypothetical protein